MVNCVFDGCVDGLGFGHIDELIEEFGVEVDMWKFDRVYKCCLVEEHTLWDVGAGDPHYRHNSSGTARRKAPDQFRWAVYTESNTIFEVFALVFVLSILFRIQCAQVSHDVFIETFNTYSTHKTGAMNVVNRAFVILGCRTIDNSNYMAPMTQSAGGSRTSKSYQRAWRTLSIGAFVESQLCIEVLPVH